MSSENPFRQALEFLRGGEYWHKGDCFGGEDNSNACLLGVALRLNAPTSFELILQDVIAEQYPGRFRVWKDGSTSIPSFNDHPDTSWEDIERGEVR